MVVTSGNTPDEAYLRSVVEANGIDVVGRLEEGVSVENQVSIVGKAVSVFHSLHPYRCFGQLKLEVTALVGLDGVACGIGGEYAVHQEMHALHGYGGAFVEYPAAEAHGICVHEVHGGCFRARVANRDGGCSRGCAVIAEGAVLRSGGNAVSNAFGKGYAR